MVVGIARTCYNMDELKQKMRQMFGKGNVQYELFNTTPQQSRPTPKKPLTDQQVAAERAELDQATRKIKSVMEDMGATET